MLHISFFYLVFFFRVATVTRQRAVKYLSPPLHHLIPRKLRLKKITNTTRKKNANTELCYLLSVLIARCLLLFVKVYRSALGRTRPHWRKRKERKEIPLTLAGSNFGTFMINIVKRQVFKAHLLLFIPRCLSRSHAKTQQKGKKKFQFGDKSVLASLA